MSKPRIICINGATVSKTNTVNENEELLKLIQEMLSAIDLCLESGGLTWEAEQ